MQANRFLFGVKKVGFIKRILGVGFNGTVVTLWAEDSERKTTDKSEGGLRLSVILLKSKITAEKEI